MRYMTLKDRFFVAWDTMVLMYTQYPAITPIEEKQIEDDLIAYLDKHGYITDELCSDDDRFIIVNTKITAGQILKDVMEVQQHD